MPPDIAKKFDPKAHNHVVFVRNNKYYEVQMDKDSIPLSIAELSKRKLRRSSSLESTAVPVGGLTSENRNIWAGGWEQIIKTSPNNAQSLERIKPAIIIVPLDDTKTRGHFVETSGRWWEQPRPPIVPTTRTSSFDNGRAAGTPSFPLQVLFDGLSECDQGDTQYIPRMIVIYLDHVTFSIIFSGNTFGMENQELTAVLVQRQPRMYTGNTALFLMEYRSDGATRNPISNST